MSTPAERLRDARTKAGFTSGTDAARSFGWTISTYLGHENGSRGLAVDAAQRYAKAFKVAWEYLLTGAADRTESADYGTPIMGRLGPWSGGRPRREDAPTLPVGVEGYDRSELAAYIAEHGRHILYLLTSIVPGQAILVGDEIVIATLDSDGREELSSWLISEQDGREIYIQNIGLREGPDRLMEFEAFFAQPSMSLVGVVVATYTDMRRRKAIESAGFTDRAMQSALT